MKRILVIVAFLALGGCASLQDAGTTQFSAQPIVEKDGSILCCKVEYTSGKEIASVHAEVHKHGSDYDMTVEETGVKAFAGQQISADALKASAAEAGKAAALAAIAPVLPAVLPAAGAALASPGIGAAAVGAGAVLGTQKLLAPATPPTMSAPVTMDTAPNATGK